MALRIAVPNYPLDPPNAAEPLAVSGPTAGERRARLESYLALDPAFRFLIALALVAAISLLYLGQASSVTALNYEVQSQVALHTKLVHEQQDLQLQIAHAQALPQIAETAKTKLGMVPVGKAFRYLDVPAEVQVAAPSDVQAGVPAVGR